MDMRISVAAAIPNSWSPELRGHFLQAFDRWRSSDSRPFDYADTFRIARIDAKDEILIYESLRQNGCCASEDLLWNLPDAGARCGIMVLFGFNYGH